MFAILKREWIYFFYYFDLQFRQIFPYYALGILIGSFISVFLKQEIFRMVSRINQKSPWAIISCSILGILSPLCLYGTIPIAASFSKSGIKDDLLAAFMVGSILLNPQLIIYSMALGPLIVVIRILSALLCAILAGFLVKTFCSESLFNFNGFSEPTNRDLNESLILRYLENVGRNVKATGLYFLIGIILSALFSHYVPSEFITELFNGNRAWGVLIAATVGVPLYACGGGTIPLLQAWLIDGMSLGSASAFMITGPATKITNLGALKTVLGLKNFILYLIYMFLCAFLVGITVNILFPSWNYL